MGRPPKYTLHGKPVTLAEIGQAADLSAVHAGRLVRGGMTPEQVIARGRLRSKYVRVVGRLARRSGLSRGVVRGRVSEGWSQGMVVEYGAALRLHRAIATARPTGPTKRGEGERSNDHLVIRCLVILAAIAATPHGLGVKELIERTGVSRSTLYRDLAILRSVGLPLVSVEEERGGPVRWKIDVGDEAAEEVDCG